MDQNTNYGVDMWWLLGVRMSGILLWQRQALVW